MSSNEPRLRRDVVVVGGSAGALAPLQTMLGGLTPDYQGALLIVVHQSSTSPSLLDRILGRATALPCGYARDGEAIVPGRVYLAPPNRHLVIEDSVVRVVFGPKQNRHRPAINPLFLSAAKVYGPRVCGVILSGMLDDGTIGLMAIRDAGGATIIQSPDDASFPAMPQHALEYVDADYTVPVQEIPDILVDLSREPVPETALPTVQARITEPAGEEIAMISGSGTRQQPEALTCPECGGALSGERTGDVLQYYCFLGHGYSSDTLWQDSSDRVEQALWTALRTTEESLALGQRLVGEARQKGNGDQALEIRRGLERLEGRAQKLRAILYEEQE